LHVPAERKRATAVLNTGRVPANCRIPLRYIQQFAGTHTKPSSRKLYEFYEVCLSGDQHRRYVSTTSTLPKVSFFSQKAKALKKENSTKSEMQVRNLLAFSVNANRVY